MNSLNSSVQFAYLDQLCDLEGPPLDLPSLYERLHSMKDSTSSKVSNEIELQYQDSQGLSHDISNEQDYQNALLNSSMSGSKILKFTIKEKPKPNEIQELEALLQDFSKMPECTEKYLLALQYLSKLRQLPSFPNTLPLFNLQKTLNKIRERITIEGLQFLNLDTSLANYEASFMNEDWKSTSQSARELLRETQPLNIQEIIRLVQNSQSSVNMAAKQDVVLFFGSTGAGKSTTIHFLAGSEMKQEEGSDHIFPRKIHNQGLHKITTSASSRSETRYITSVTVNFSDIEGSCENDTIILCDTSGRNDSADAEVDIANSVSIQRVVQSSKSVRPVFLISFKDLGDRLQGIQDMVNFLKEMIPKIEDHRKSLIFMFTKFPKERRQKIHTSIKILLEDMDASERGDKIHVAILEHMLEKTEESELITIDPIGDKNPGHILDKIAEARPIERPDEVFKFTMSEESRSALRKQILRNQTTIQKALEHSDLELIRFKFQQLSTLHELVGDKMIKKSLISCVKDINDHINKEHLKASFKINTCMKEENSLSEGDIKEYKEKLVELNSLIDLIKVFHNEREEDFDLLENLEKHIVNLLKRIQYKNFDDPTVKSSFEKLQLISKHFPQFIKSCEKANKFILVSFDKAYENYSELLKNEKFQESEVELTKIKHFSLSSFPEFTKKYQQLKEELIHDVKFTIPKLIESVLNKSTFSQEDIETINSELSKLELIKAAFTRGNHISQEEIELVCESCADKIQSYFERLTQNIEKQMESLGYECLPTIQESFIQLRLIRNIQFVENKTVGSYFQILEKLRNITQEIQRKIIENIDLDNNKMNNLKILSLIHLLAKDTWIDNFGTDLYSQALNNIQEEILKFYDHLKGLFKKRFISIHEMEKWIEEAQKVIATVDDMSCFEDILPELNKDKLEIISLFEERIDSYLETVEQLLEKYRQKMNNFSEFEWKESEKNVFERFLLCVKVCEGIPRVRVKHSLLQENLEDFLRKYHKHLSKTFTECFYSIDESRQNLVSGDSEKSDLSNSTQDCLSVPVRNRNKFCLSKVKNHIKTISECLRFVYETKNQYPALYEVFDSQQKLIIQWQKRLIQELHDEITDNLNLLNTMQKIKSLKRMLELVRSLRSLDDFLPEKNEYRKLYNEFNGQVYEKAKEKKDNIIRAINAGEYENIQFLIDDFMADPEDEGNNHSEKNILKEIQAKLRQHVENLREETGQAASSLRIKENITFDRFNSIVKNLKKLRKISDYLSPWLDFQTVENLKGFESKVKKDVGERLKGSIESIKFWMNHFDFKKSNKQKEILGIIIKTFSLYCEKNIQTAFNELDLYEEEKLKELEEKYTNLKITEYPGCNSPKTIFSKFSECVHMKPAIYRRVQDKMEEKILQAFKKELEGPNIKKLQSVENYSKEYLPESLAGRVKLMLLECQDKLDAAEETLKTSQIKQKQQSNSIEDYKGENELSKDSPIEPRLKLNHKPILLDEIKQSEEAISENFALKNTPFTIAQHTPLTGKYPQLMEQHPKEESHYQAKNDFHNLSKSKSPYQSNLESIHEQDFFLFLKKEPKSSPRSFFSENGLSQDIIQVTQAEPDICLEVFYALYNTLCPQIDNQPDVSFKDTWTKFIGDSQFKGSLSPPEKLMAKKRVRDVKTLLSQNGGENQVFHDLDQVVSSISHLKEKIENHQSQILQKEAILESLCLVQEFYLRFRNQVKTLVQAIIEKERNHAPNSFESEALEDLLEPKAIMMSDVFAQHWAYRISRNRAQRLLSLDAYGRNSQRNASDSTNHRVTSLPEGAAEPLVFFKANGNPPIQPEKEFMLYSLYRHLQIPVPETSLLILSDVFETNPDYFYAVQASEAVLGESPLQAFRNPETTFDHEAYSLQAIGALLTNPSDGSLKNFKYSPVYQTFISLNNDLVFKPELTGKDYMEAVNVKSILYLLPQIDLPISKSMKTLFSTVDVDLTIFSWLKDLSQKNQKYKLLYTKLNFQKTRCNYQNLLPQSEVPSLAICLQEKVQVDHELNSDYVYPQISVSNELLTQLTEKLQVIEKKLLENHSISIQNLFEEISPVLGKYYRKLRFEFNDPEEASEALWRNEKNDIDYSYISSILDQEFIKLSSSKTELEKNLPPETFFKVYQDFLTSRSAPLDKFIWRHNERKKKNMLSLQVTLKELQFLIQEGFTNSQYPREILDLSSSLPRMIGSDPELLKDLITLLSNLPHPELKWLLTLEKYFLRSEQHIPKDLRPSSLITVGAFMKQRIFILTETENKYLFDQQGNIKKNMSLTGRSNVTCFPEKNPEFYLKQYPELPGYEFASILLMRLLGIQHLPYQDLLIINSKYPVLLSQKVSGDPVIRIWHNSQAFHNLDPVHTGLLIISAMLINPEDGKEDNFILSPDGRYLIPIDNDHCFLPSTFQRKRGSWHTLIVTGLQTKTLLFCLDEMFMPIPLEVKQHLLSLDFDLLLTQWMTELVKVEDRLQNLIEHDQGKRFLKHGTVLRIPFDKQLIHHIYWKAHKIQEILKTTPEITPFDLLKSVEPIAAKYYENSFKQGFDPQSRFRAATNNLYGDTAMDSRRVSTLNTHAMMKIINVSEKDRQNDTLFQRMGPTDALEKLYQLIQERSHKASIEQETLCELDEKAKKNKWISLFGDPPGETPLEDFFANSKEGLILRGSKLITYSRLTELPAQILNNAVTTRFISLPGSLLLTEKEIRILTERCPNLEYLNVSSCLKLKQIITTTIDWPLLSRLDAKDCDNLEKFVSYSPIKILQIGTNQKIELFVKKVALDIFTISNKEIEFEFSFKKGESFKIKSRSSSFSYEDFIKDILILEKWNHIKNSFQDIKITIGGSTISSVQDLAFFVHALNFQNSDVKIENIQAMTMLNLIHLKSLDLSFNVIDEKGIEILTLGKWPFLEELNLHHTKIAAKEVEALLKGSNWPNLKYLNISENEINDNGVEILIQGNWSSLETLNLEDTKITDIGVELIVTRSKWPQLKNLNISENEINDKGVEILIQGNWPSLETLNLEGTKITDVGVAIMVNTSNWPQLKNLNLSKNRISDEELQKLAQGNWDLLETPSGNIRKDMVGNLNE